VKADTREVRAAGSVVDLEDDREAQVGGLAPDASPQLRQVRQPAPDPSDSGTSLATLSCAARGGSA